MLTPEQRDELKAAAYGRGFVHDGLLRAVLAHLDAQQVRIAELEKDERAQEVAINDLIDKNNALEQKLRGIANYLRNAGATLPAPPAAGTIESAMNHGLCIALLVVEEAMQPTWPEDTSDYGSRIAIVGQNGNDGLAYQEEQP